jgi:hypothetical protein
MRATAAWSCASGRSISVISVIPLLVLVLVEDAVNGMVLHLRLEERDAIHLTCDLELVEDPPAVTSRRTTWSRPR